jgi:hypothetical protein
MSLFAPVGSVLQQSASQAARKGVERGLDMFAQAAQQIASGGTSNPIDYAESAVQMLEARTLVRASGKMLRVADRMLGTLLDVRS